MISTTLRIPKVRDLRPYPTLSGERDTLLIFGQTMRMRCASEAEALVWIETSQKSWVGGLKHRYAQLAGDQVS